MADTDLSIWYQCIPNASIIDSVAIKSSAQELKLSHNSYNIASAVVIVHYKVLNCLY